MGDQIIKICERLAALEAKMGLMVWGIAIIGALIIKDAVLGPIIRLIRNGGKNNGQKNSGSEEIDD